MHCIVQTLTDNSELIHSQDLENSPDENGKGNVADTGQGSNNVQHVKAPGITACLPAYVQTDTWLYLGTGDTALSTGHKYCTVGLLLYLAIMIAYLNALDKSTTAWNNSITACNKSTDAWDKSTAAWDKSTTAWNKLATSTDKSTAA